MPRKTDFLAAAALAALVLLFWWDVLGGGKALYIRDVARGLMPEHAVLGEILRGGELPLWNPHFGAGQPLAANPMYEAFYPPQWLAALPDFFAGVHIEIVLHLLLAALGMFAFLRSLALRSAAAFFGALTFAFGGTILSATSLFPILFSLAWWPLIAMFVHRQKIAPAALALGMMFLAAEQSMMVMASALIAAYCVWRLRARGIAVAALIGIAAFLVASVQLVPALDFQRDSGRAAPLAYAAAGEWRMTPLRPLELLVPSAFGRFTADAIYFWASSHSSRAPWLFSWYAGMLAAVLAIAGFVYRIRGWRPVAIICAVSYAFAVYPLHYWLGLRSIRYPEKFFIPATFFLIVLAAIAADRFLDDARFRITTFRVSLAASVVAAGALAFAWSPLFARAWHLGGYFDDIVREARIGGLTTLATAATLVLILLFRERPRLVLPLLGAFVLADLAPRMYGLAPRIGRAYYDPPPIASKIPRGARIYNDAAWRVMLAPQPPIAYDARWVRMRNAMFTEMQALWGFDSALELDVSGTMLRPTAELTRLFLDAEVRGQREVVRRVLAAAGVTHVIALPAEVIALPGNARWTIRGRILGARQTANAIDLDVDVATAARLFVSVTRHRYWRATIDGAPAAIRPANVAFQSIDVPAGRHRVAMRYNNPLIVVCGIVSLLTTIALAVVALRSRALPPPSPR